MEGGVYMNNIFDEQGHLSKDTFQTLKSGTLSELEMLSLVTHIGDCEYCADAYANVFDSDELIEVPSGFEEEIKSKLQPRIVKNKQLVFYSLRVAVAACITLAIIFSGVLNLITNVNAKALQIKPSDFSIVNSINTNLKGFSEKILNLEVQENEKKKK
jgi:hypothetical protein